MKHSEDSGELTLFADGDQLLIACDKGHYWTLEAKSGKVEKSSATETRSRLPRDLDRFGPAALRALRPDS